MLKYDFVWGSYDLSKLHVQTDMTTCVIKNESEVGCLLA